MMHLVIINVLFLYFIFNVRVIINKGALVMTCVIALYKKRVLCLGKLQCFAH